MDNMTAAQLQEAFGISRDEWRRIAARPDMMDPLDPQHTGGITKWPHGGFARWLARHHPDLADEVPHLLQPVEQADPQYFGCRLVQARGDDHRTWFAGRWRTQFGTVAVIYPCGAGPSPSPEAALASVPDAATVVVVQGDWNLYQLPWLEAVDRPRPAVTYQPQWLELSSHAGHQIPWWPAQLRREEHMTTWMPAHDPAPVEVMTWPAWEPLYDMAYAEARGTPIRSACFTIGHQLRANAVNSVRWEIEHFNKRDLRVPSQDYEQRRKKQRESMVIAAYPAVEDPAQEGLADEATLEEGLAQLCRRTDDLAVECLKHIMMWSSTPPLPFAGEFSVVLNANVTKPGNEWVQRLRKTSATAIHRLEEDGQEVAAFLDPVTQNPVTMQKGYHAFSPPDEISYHSYAPRRLPAGSRLLEVVLDDPVWVRTHDGTLYPAPVWDAPGVSWGYSGSGPGTLATLLGRLLDDGAAPAVTYGDGLHAEPRLEAFLQTSHPRGTRIPRAVLEKVRRCGPDSLTALDRWRLRRS